MLEKRPEIVSKVWSAVTGYFSPEFLGRLGRENVILFNHFSRVHYREMLDQQIAALIDEMQGRGISLGVGEDVRDALTTAAFKKRFVGARNVRRLVTVNLRDRIVDGAVSGRTVFDFSLRQNGEITA